MQPALQDIINRVNQVNNILITVKSNPSVDDLAAALGLTMALDTFGKHATAVFSGEIPNAMSFLKPQKIFENNVHSLRDFIISLNKEKADKLRFAKDGEIVKIYITPYKSTITSQDLTYDEGDFNVQMVIAIGINTQEELDSVIAAHGRILHEATVATVMPGAVLSQLGSINWSDPDLSSSSAMVLELLQNLGLQNGISPEVSTALLTGLVADTDRFSNAKTTPKVMQLAAQLMSSGANHQLVTSSIGSMQLSSKTPAPANPTATLPSIEETEGTAKKDELVLDVQSPTPIPIQPAPASNIAPMVNSPVVEPVTPEATGSSASVLEKVLPKAQAADQTIVPAELLPPAPTSPISESVPEINMPPAFEAPASPVTGPLSDRPAATSVPALEPIAPVTEAAADQIRSEIDKIYSSQPFDPANNPRQDVATQIILPEENKTNEASEESKEAEDPKVEEQTLSALPIDTTSVTPDIAAPSNSIDTAVQSEQALESNMKANEEKTPLAPIPATKNEQVNASDVLGINNSPAATTPGLELPKAPDISLPPPPPAPGANSPFGNTINFDPTKPQS
jgi:hypothetical protein